MSLKLSSYLLDYRDFFLRDNFSLNSIHTLVVNPESCDIVIYNKQYIFGLFPCFWHLKPLEFPKWYE